MCMTDVSRFDHLSKSSTSMLYSSILSSSSLHPLCNFYLLCIFYTFLHTALYLSLSHTHTRTHTHTCTRTHTLSLSHTHEHTHTHTHMHDNGNMHIYKCYGMDGRMGQIASLHTSKRPGSSISRSTLPPLAWLLFVMHCISCDALHLLFVMHFVARCVSCHDTTQVYFISHLHLCH